MPDGYTSNMEKALRNPTLHRMPVLGRVALSLLMFLVWLGALQLNGVAGHLSMAIAFFFWALSEGGLLLFRRWRLRRLNAKAEKLQIQISQLEQSATELAVAEARKSGAFDRWESK